MTRRWLAPLFALALVAAVLLPGGSAEAQNPRYWLQVVGDDGLAITSGRCRVNTAGANTLPTIYSDRTLATTVSNSLITIDSVKGECEFYAATGTTYDLWIYVTGGAYKGAAVRFDGFTQNVHRAVVSRAHGMKTLVTPLTAAAAVAINTASETLPVGALVKDVVLETTTAVATSTLIAGVTPPVTTNGPARLCNNQSTAAVGFVDCAITQFLVPTGGVTVTYSNQNHAAKGFLHVYYYAPSNEP